MRNEHALKTWPEYFRLVKTGQKLFELRRFDRPFEVGDTLVLCEYDPNKKCYTGNHIEASITCLVDGDSVEGNQFGVREGYVALGIRKWTEREISEWVDARNGQIIPDERRRK